MRKAEPRKTIVISSSGKKAGKSTLATYLVHELGDVSAMKVSADGTHPTDRPVVTDLSELSRPGTDTASLIEAGAKAVAWVNTTGADLDRALGEAMDSLPPGAVVVEGNSAASHLSPDFTVFLMSAPYEDFKPSAKTAIEHADLVLVNRSGPLGEVGLKELRKEIHARGPKAELVFFHARDRELAFEQALKIVRKALLIAEG